MEVKIFAYTFLPFTIMGKYGFKLEVVEWLEYEGEARTGLTHKLSDKFGKIEYVKKEDINSYRLIDYKKHTFFYFSSDFKLDVRKAFLVFIEKYKAKTEIEIKEKESALLRLKTDLQEINEDPLSFCHIV